MLRNLHLLFVSILFATTYSFSQSGLGTIRGSVVDGDTGEPVSFAKVLLKQDGTIKGGANTDDEGKFQINSISPGSYDVEITNSGEGYQATSMTGVIVNAERITFLDNIEMSKPKDIKQIDEMVVVAYRVPLIDKDGGASGATMTREDIARLPVRSAAGAAQTVGGINTNEGTGEISVRGSRSDATYFFIDGIKVRGSSNLPKSAIEEVSVITGGLPANYGDVTGGIISVTTRGPSSKYFGSIEGVTSGFYFKGRDPDGYDGKVFGLDQYAYNLVEGMFSGPLFMKKDSTGAKVKPILGFLVSASYLNELDNRPLNGGSYRVKRDVRDSLLASPLVANASGDGTFYAATLLRKDDFENTKWRMNARNQTLSAQAKIDVNTGPSVNLSFGGSMNYSDGSLYSRNNSLLNFQNFGKRVDLDWRVFGRLTQRFSNNREGSSSKVKSANYSLMVDYSQTRRRTFDPKHGFNFFNYGHVGTFRSNYDTSLVYVDSLNAYVQQTVPFQNGISFEASEANPGLAAVTNQYYDMFGTATDINQLRNRNGLINGDVPINVYQIWENLGAPYNGGGAGINGLGIFENNQFRVTGSGSINIGDHSISLGFEYEQRTDRGWGIGDQGPIGLWNHARLLANGHISEIDVTRPTIVQEGAYRRIYFDRLNTGYAYNNGGIYGGAQSGATGGQVDYQSFFDYNVRKELGLNPGGSDILDIDSYDPSMFSFSMFSPDELLNNGNSYVSYYGYDHTGQKVRGRTDIDKYFSEFDENGNYRRFVGAFQPTYISGYIMDKFAFRDLVFNVGVRVDVFDANQPVLKDMYLFRSALTAGEARGMAGTQDFEWVVIPESMGDDYTVYVDNASAPGQINGFRSGDAWFNANGDPVEDPTAIRGPNGIAPWLQNPNQATIGSDAFEDYRAQVSVMPRIAFSFPVSEESSFFAHYDILTKRPTTGVRFDPFEYQFIQTRSAVINNSNLRPEKTIDYELGFQQVLTRTSSLKISAFYREQRDNVQLRSVVEAYPTGYRTFGNIDFGTVKGVTIAYDLRRTGNIRMTAAYTLQFADGTGSDATSMAGLINAGLPNLRAIFPYSFDQRHAFAISFDYRYGEGSDYNGPRINDFQVFANTGLNIMANIYSGNPYSRKINIVNEGMFNPLPSGLDGTTHGSRLPWSYRLDLQLDRTFDFEVGKTDDKKRVLFLNVYLRITNLLNQQNILSVYRATGNWDDDGYLEAADSQASIQAQQDEQSFRDYYLLKIQNPYNISAPRTIRLGVKFDF